MSEEKASFVDRLGPTLTSALVVAVLSATSLGAVSIRDLVITSNVDIAYLKSEYASLRSELEKFKSPGGRFTSEDGAKHENRLEKLEEFQASCSDTKANLSSKIDKLEDKQSNLCFRVHECIDQERINGYPPRNNSNGNRSRN